MIRHDPQSLRTIFSCYKTVEDYLTLVQAAWGKLPSSAVRLQPIDVLLLQLIAADYPRRPTVVDLAGDATFGASTVLWLGQTVVHRVITPRLTAAPAVAPDWRGLLPDVLERLQLRERPSLLDVAFDQPQGEAAIREELPSSSPAIFLVPAGDDASAETVSRLDRVFRLRRDAVAFVLPLGPVGESLSLERVIAFATVAGAYRLRLLREVTPFLGASRLGVVYSADDLHTGDILDRLRRLYAGNFEFVSLLEKAIEASAEEQPRSAALHATHPDVQAETAGLRQRAEEQEVKLARQEEELTRLTGLLHGLATSTTVRVGARLQRLVYRTNWLSDIVKRFG